MKKKNLLAMSACALAFSLAFFTSCGNKAKTEDTNTADTTLTTDANANAADAQLKALAEQVAPKFKQETYKDSASNKEMSYMLFAPANIEPGKKYPMVVFLADAKATLADSYGALVWAGYEMQKDDPAYVLMPLFQSAPIGENFQPGSETALVEKLIQNVAAANAVNTKRIYAAAQNSGAELAMYLTTTPGNPFAASILADAAFDTAKAAQLVKNKFVYFVYSGNTQAAASMTALEDACRKAGVSYSTSEWSSELPAEQQDDLAETMLDKGAPIVAFKFENATATPADAFKVESVRDWLFDKSK